MEYLLLSNDEGDRCEPMLRIDSVVLNYLGVIDGKEEWCVSVTCEGDGKWHECYRNVQAATDRYNELVEMLKSAINGGVNDNGEN